VREYVGIDGHCVPVGFGSRGYRERAAVGVTTPTRFREVRWCPPSPPDGRPAAGKAAWESRSWKWWPGTDRFAKRIRTDERSESARRARIGSSRFESIEPSTRGFSVRERGAWGATRPKNGKEFPAARSNRPPRPNRFRAWPSELRTEPAATGMQVEGLRWGGPKRADRHSPQPPTPRCPLSAKLRSW